MAVRPAGVSADLGATAEDRRHVTDGGFAPANAERRVAAGITGRCDDSLEMFGRPGVQLLQFLTDMLELALFACSSCATLKGRWTAALS